MTTSSADQYLVIGAVVAVYGIKGWVKIKSFTEPSENFANYQDCYLRFKQVAGSAKAMQPVSIEQVKVQGKGLVAKIAGVDDRNAAEALGKCEVVVSADALPELEADEFYWHQLEGLKVYSSYSAEDAPVLLGEVSHLLETGANDVLVVKACKGSIDNKERLLPYRPEVIENIDLAAGRIDSLWDPEF